MKPHTMLYGAFYLYFNRKKELFYLFCNILVFFTYKYMQSMQLELNLRT